jgi:hypothetical protein
MSRTLAYCPLPLGNLEPLVLSPDEVIAGGSRFPSGEAVILRVPAPSELRRVKLMVLNYVKMWKQGLE